MNFYAFPSKEPDIYHVGYTTPGCDIKTVVSTNHTLTNAQDEAARLNHAQSVHEAEIQEERRLRGFRMMSNDLSD